MLVVEFLLELEIGLGPRAPWRLMYIWFYCCSLRGIWGLKRCSSGVFGSQFEFFFGRTEGALGFAWTSSGLPVVGF